MRCTKVPKPFTDECYHYEVGDVHVGEVWRNDTRWSAFCACKTAYGHLTDFVSRVAAEAALQIAQLPPAQS